MNFLGNISMSGDRKLGQLEQMTEFMNVCANTWNIVSINRIQENIQTLEIPHCPVERWLAR